MTYSAKVHKHFPDLKPGDMLYAVITYRTLNLFQSYYLPRPYFLLEVTVVREIMLSSEPQYEFDTNFMLDSTLAYREIQRAQNALTGIFTEQTEGILTRDKVKLLSAQEYTEGAAKYEAAKLARVS